VTGTATQETRRKCVRYLYIICGHQALVPRSLVIPLCYNPAEDPLCRGGFSDVWKGQLHGRDVAAKALRLIQKDDFGKMRSRFCREAVAWKALRHENILPLLGVTMTEGQLVMVSEWMENGSIDEFVKAHTNANRLELLVDAVRGLMYMHDQGIIHGNLTGDNILVDNNCRARLAGFSLLSMASDQPTTPPSANFSGTVRWMSPELLLPDSFGLKDNGLTRESDCYALGMVIYEVLSGEIPFASRTDTATVFKVLEGERPERPQGTQGARFTDSIWGMLELCWKPRPSDRPNLDIVLRCLQDAARPSIPSCGRHENVEIGTRDQPGTTSSDSAVAGLSIIRGGNRPLVSSQTPSRRGTGTDFGLATTHSESGSVVPQDDDNPPDLPQQGGPQGGWVGRLAYGAHRIFKAVIGKFYGP